MITTEWNWKTSDGTSIYAKTWTPDGVKGVVCMVHGLGEHINRYEHVAAFFNEKGFVFMGNDHYGHGKSGGSRGHTPSYEALLQEVDTLIQHAQQQYPNKPIFLYGHSMGGNIVLNYLFKRKPQVNGVISTAPAIIIPNPPPAILVAIGRLMRHIFPKFSQPNGLILDGISRDKTVVEKYKKDPLVHNKVSSELGLSLLETGDWLISKPQKTPIPLLLMHGTADILTSPKGTTTLAERTEGEVTLKLWKDFFHEIHNEKEQQEVFNFIWNWVKI